MTLTLGSLFAGIGGLDLGFERAGFKVRWQVENDDYCNRVLAKHWPDVRRYGDINEVTGHELECVDVIAGGFPCQDISNAGKRAGITGKQSGLWTEFARIIRVVRPRFVVVENVSALLGRGMGVVLGDLAESGYDAEWGCVSAASMGAPHLRWRVFIIAYLANAIGTRLEVGQRESRDAGQECPPAQRSGESVANALRAICGPRSGRRGVRQGGEAVNGGHWSVEPDVGRVAHGGPSRVDRLRGLGNAVVPQVAEFVARRVKALDKLLVGGIITAMIYPEPTCSNCHWHGCNIYVGEEKPDGATSFSGEHHFCWCREWFDLPDFQARHRAAKVLAGDPNRRDQETCDSWKSRPPPRHTEPIGKVT